ncbi:MAG: oxidoreductase, 2OG-Fe(II) oxygenase family protein [Bacteroidetes bacterium]|jgi:alkylated DNA repair dioxygenase AlkB|nr:oxidoreductase, 2OG-Fe(II) oxygenase family protein [Bacteroidota bacterium]
MSLKGAPVAPITENLRHLLTFAKIMDLFNDIPDMNILPYDGEVSYYGAVLSKFESDIYFNSLLNNIEWRNDEAILYGKHIITSRKVAWYGDKPFNYTYSGTTKQALPWIKELEEIKELIEIKTGETFNSCLLNLYHNGDEGMAWHSDDEKALKKNAAIASLSLGAERKFSFKHKQTKESRSIILEHGSLLVMAGETQINWTHRLPPTKLVKKARINLTFRTMESALS